MFEFLKERPNPVEAPVVLHERLDSAEVIDNRIASCNNEIDKCVANIRAISNKLACCIQPYNAEELELNQKKTEYQTRVAYLQVEVARLQEQARQSRVKDDLQFIQRIVDNLDKEVSSLHSAITTKEVAYKQELINLSNKQYFKLQELANAKQERSRLELLLRKQAS